MIFKADFTPLLIFELNSSGSKIPKFPEFNLSMLYFTRMEQSYQNSSFGKASAPRKKFNRAERYSRAPTFNEFYFQG